MANFCQNCGTKLEQGAAFCPSCGKKIETDRPTVNLAKTEQPPAEHFSVQTENQSRYVPDNTFAEMFLKRDGRLNRLRYFKRSLVLALINMVAIILCGVVFLAEWEETNDTFEIVTSIIALLFVYPDYCLNVRRLQDIDGDMRIAYGMAAVSVFFALFSDFASESVSVAQGLLALVYIGIGFYLLLAPGTKGDNRYGADPLGNS